MTFPAERQHKVPKELMNHCYTNYTKTGMAYWLRDRVAVVMETGTFQAYLVTGTCFEKVDEMVSLEAFGGACRIVGTRNSLRTPKGTFSKHDFVYWGIHVGIAKKIIQGVDGGGRCQFAGVFEKYAPARGNVWASAGKIVVVVD